jgi:hypothetical protein
MTRTQAPVSGVEHVVILAAAPLIMPLCLQALPLLVAPAEAEAGRLRTCTGVGAMLSMVFVLYQAMSKWLVNPTLIVQSPLGSRAGHHPGIHPPTHRVRSRHELVTTATEEKAIMAAAIEGLSMMPNPGSRAPVAGRAVMTSKGSQPWEVFAAVWKIGHAGTASYLKLGYLPRGSICSG